MHRVWTVRKCLPGRGNQSEKQQGKGGYREMCGLRTMRGRVSQRCDQNPVGWAPFDQLADQYDNWFESKKGQQIFRVEAECIRNLMEETSRPWLEVGVGTGRFAAALTIDEGVDASPSVLRYAAKRGIRVKRGKAEKLPYKSNSFGITLLVVTICFLDDPAKALKECLRVLRKDGQLIIGLVPRNSSWGKAYTRKGAKGHPFYSAATFYTTQQVIRLAEQAGFVLNRATSCLFEHPDKKVKRYALPREGLTKGAGFVGMRFEMRKEI